MSIKNNRNLMVEQMKKLKGGLNESKAPRELKKHLGKTVKDFKYNDGGNVQELTIFFTDGTKLEVSAYGETEGCDSVAIDWEL